MIRSYQLAATVKINHEFYQGGKFNDLEIIPNSETQYFLDQQGIQVRQNGNEFSIYTRNDNAASAPQNDWPAMHFHIRITSVYFFNFTDLPSNLKPSGSQIFLFTQYPGKNTMTSQAFAGSNDLFEYRGNNFAIPAPDQTNDILVLKNKYGNHEKKVIDTGSGSLQVNMDGETSGYFELWSGEDRLTTGFFDIGFPSRPPFGILEFQLNPTDTDPVHFEINFAARKTIWRYYIINPRNLDLSDLKIESSDPDLSFHEGEEATLPDNSKARVFYSDPTMPIALLNQPILKNKLISSNAAFQIDLPNASPDRIEGIEKDGQPQFYSDIYIYL